MTSRLLERGIALWKNGQKNQARGIFKAVIYNEQDNETAWLWYIYSLESSQEKIAALETFLNISPNNEKAKSAIEGLRNEGKKAEATQGSEASPPEVNNNSLVTEHPVKSKPRVETTANSQKSHIQYGLQNMPKASITIPWVLVIFGVFCLFCSSTIFFVNQSSLRADYEAEKQAHQQLVSKYEQLKGDYQALTTEYDNMIQQYNTLVTKFNNLNQEYALTVDKYNSLVEKYNSLTGEYTSLTDDYNTLNNIAIKPPYIVVHDRMVDTTFYDTDGQLIAWTTPIASLEYDFENGSYMRRLIVDQEWKTTLAHTNNNAGIWIRDYSLFISPTTFRNVIPELYQKSSNSYEFIYRIWYMIGQLSNYASEDIETPRYPLETLLAGGGDCEDLSILFASMIKAAPVNWYVDLVYVDSENINNPQSLDHVVVYINTGQETYIVETTNDQDMLPYENGVTGWLASKLSSSDQYKYPDYLR